MNKGKTPGQVAFEARFSSAEWDKESGTYAQMWEDIAQAVLDHAATAKPPIYPPPCAAPEGHYFFKMNKTRALCGRCGLSLVPGGNPS